MINTVEQLQKEQNIKMNYNNNNNNNDQLVLQQIVRASDNNNFNNTQQNMSKTTSNMKKSNILSSKINDSQHINKLNTIDNVEQNQNHNYNNQNFKHNHNYHHQHHNQHNHSSSNHHHHHHFNNQHLHHQNHYHNHNLTQPLIHGSQIQLSVQNKRKEKARIAARARRSQEASIILEMAEELHLTQEKIRRIDKATIVKLAIDYIKAFDVLCRFCYEKVIYDQLQQLEEPERAELNPEQSRINEQLEQHVQQQQQQQVALNDVVNSKEKLSAKDEAEVNQRTIKTNSSTMPKLSTSSIFTPKTNEMDLNFLMIDGKEGKESFVLKPDEEILEEDDLTHLAPQAGEVINLDFDSSLDDIVVDSSLFLLTSPISAAQATTTTTT